MPFGVFAVIALFGPPWGSALKSAGEGGDESPHSRMVPRFRNEAPLPSASPVMIDEFVTGGGIANEYARSRSLQARIMWIDATANIDRYNTTAKIEELAAKIKDSGFNTVVLDVKPISGQTIYKSAFAPKLIEWRGQKLPEDFDPLPDMARACHSQGLSLFASMNAFSEGHRLFKVGPGYQTPEHQSVLYVPKPFLRADDATIPLSPVADHPSNEAVTILSSPSKRPANAEGFAIRVDGDKRVVSVYGPTTASIPSLKSGENLLYGQGDAGEFLRRHYITGDRVVVDTEASYVASADQPGTAVPLMMDPNDPEVRSRALNMVREVVGKYDVDGIIYDDRLRYTGLDGDFSETSRRLFEKHVGKQLQWPDDVFKFTFTLALTKGIQPGPYYDAWMSWRAQRIREYVAVVRNAVRGVRPTAQLGVYAGSWYGEYPALGHNYASPFSEPGFWFSTPSYRSTGTAPLMDFLIVGCYYPTATIYDALRKDASIGATVEAAGALCNAVVRDETWTYAGIEVNSFSKDPSKLADVLQAACASTQGVMLFDLSHDMELYWPTIKRAFLQPRKAPHQVAGALAELHRRRSVLDAMHLKERPVVITAGSTGVGQ